MSLVFGFGVHARQSTAHQFTFLHQQTQLDTIAEFRCDIGFQIVWPHQRHFHALHPLNHIQRGRTSASSGTPQPSPSTVQHGPRHVVVPCVGLLHCFPGVFGPYPAGQGDSSVVDVPVARQRNDVVRGVPLHGQILHQGSRRRRGGRQRRDLRQVVKRATTPCTTVEFTVGFTVEFTGRLKRHSLVWLLWVLLVNAAKGGGRGISGGQ